METRLGECMHGALGLSYVTLSKSLKKCYRK